MNDEILTKYSYDELIDNIMIYWTSANITDTMKIYAEQFTESENELVAQLINSYVIIVHKLLLLIIFIIRYKH